MQATETRAGLRYVEASRLAAALLEIEVVCTAAAGSP